MSHHNDHDHDHHHTHGHAHQHHHDDTQHSHGTLSFEEKMIKLLEHWIKHNDDHADSYKDWAEKAQTHGMPEAGTMLAEVAAMTENITGKFQQILASVKK